MKIPLTLGKGLIAFSGLGSSAVYFGTNNLTLGGGLVSREIEIISSELGFSWKENFTFLSQGTQGDQKIAKKFLLIGLNKETNNVEMVGLVSLVKKGHNGIKKCADWRKLQNSSETEKKIPYGECDDIFFQAYTDSKLPPNFIEKELKDENNKQVGILKINSNSKLSIVFAKKNNWSKTYSRSGMLLLTKEATKKSNFFVGKASSSNRPYAVVHDNLIFAKGSLKDKWKKVEEQRQSLLEIGKRWTKVNGSEIPLEQRRQYYLWDPSHTHIKNGKFETKDGQKLPWNNNDQNLPFSFNLVK